MGEGLMLSWAISCFSVAVMCLLSTFVDMKQSRPQK